MNWIKQHYAEALLAVFAVVLLAMSALLIMNARGFEDTFAGIRGEVRKNNTIPPLDVAPLEQAKAKLAQPASWTPKPGAASLFVAEQYIVQDGVLKAPFRDKTGSVHAPVPNQWFLDTGLDILDRGILQSDPDGDGFSNLEEWTGLELSNPGAKSTDPQDKQSHPPFVAKLRLAKFIQVPFRLLFNAYDGNPAKPEAMQFQVNTIDVNLPTQFRKLGEQIEGTKFKVLKFELKSRLDSSTGENEDVSELTVQNTDTQALVVLIKEKIANSPDSYAQFRLLLDNSEFKVKKDQVFALKPEPERKYKLIDISEREALIEDLKTGEKIKVSHL